MPTKAAFVAQFPTGLFLLSSLCAIIIPVSYTHLSLLIGFCLMLITDVLLV